MVRPCHPVLVDTTFSKTPVSPVIPSVPLVTVTSVSLVSVESSFLKDNVWKVVPPITEKPWLTILGLANPV